MKIALIGDIHANLNAFEAVLEDIRVKGDIDEIWNLGDAIGFGANPDEVVSKLRKDDIPGIRGNYDLKILKFPDKKQTWEKEKSFEKFSMLKYSFEQLSEKNVSYLTDLPDERVFLRQGWKILLVHGSPISQDDYIGLGTQDTRLAMLAGKTQANIVICGHSHSPFYREANGTTFINPGSVGLQFDGDLRASYAILTLKNRSIQVNHYRISYDIHLAVAAISEKGLPEVYAKMIRLGRGYREVFVKDSQTGAPPDRTACVQSALELGRSRSFEKSHAVQTASLALKLFDCLWAMHGLSPKERIILECAAILHDIGVTMNVKSHHKHSMYIIIEHGLIPFSPDEIILIALIARYHRKALPSMKHDRFAALSKPRRNTVAKLAALLRLADGLDRTHRNVVKDIVCELLPDSIRINCRVSESAEEEMAYGLIKSDLMRIAFDRRVEIGIQTDDN